jgi:hypothetical protein
MTRRLHRYASRQALRTEAERLRELAAKTMNLEARYLYERAAENYDRAAAAAMQGRHLEAQAERLEKEGA